MCLSDMSQALKAPLLNLSINRYGENIPLIKIKTFL